MVERQRDHTTDVEIKMCDGKGAHTTVVGIEKAEPYLLHVENHAAGIPHTVEIHAAGIPHTVEIHAAGIPQTLG